MDITFDILGTPEAGHFFFSGGTDGVFFFFKFTPKPGFNVVKVTHGVNVLWERTGPHLLSLTLHKLENLPVALLLHFDGSDLHFLFDVSTGWKSVTKFAYEHKLHGHSHHFDPVDFVLDFAHADPKDVVVVPVKYEQYVTTLFTPGLGKVFVAVKEGDDVLWKAGHPCDKCLLVSVHSLDGVAGFAHLTVVEAGDTLERCFEKVGGKWALVPPHSYFGKRGPEEPHPTSVDLSAKEHPHVFFCKGAPYGLPFNVFFASLISAIFEVKDSDQVLWVSHKGEVGLRLLFGHDGLHAHLLTVTPTGLEEHGFEKKDGKWVSVEDIFPEKFRVPTNE